MAQEAQTMVLQISPAIDVKDDKPYVVNVNCPVAGAVIVSTFRDGKLEIYVRRTVPDLVIVEVE
jgi:hypothetical protein